MEHVQEIYWWEVNSNFFLLLLLIKVKKCL